MTRFTLWLKRPEVRLWLIMVIFLIIGGVFCWLLWQQPESLGVEPESVLRDRLLVGAGVATASLLLFINLFFINTRLLGRRAFRQTRKQAGNDEDLNEENTRQDKPHHAELQDIKTRLRRRYGLFWRYKVRLLMVVGETPEITALAPRLAEQGWLEGQRTVLLHGGSLHQPADATRLAELRKLRRSRPLDGVVWALTQSQSRGAQWMDDGLRSLEKSGEALRYQPPVYLWQVCDSRWGQDGRVTQPVGAILAASAGPDTLERQLLSLLPALREQGMQQVFAEQRHDFLLRLAHSLETTEAMRWRQVLTPWFADYAARIPLRGLMFSLPEISATAEGVHEKPGRHRPAGRGYWMTVWLRAVAAWVCRGSKVCVTACWP